ncbi:uncharacterized protein CDAR_621481 [Caerostris darwini]|uniref:Uncharacterized protein n=1 Tax=Caerostris darwini TaxID=1538125 RepID=A0AAV4VCG8_9ARAC|nr:uncharacterized protein CDAR_621481 [Caerostris darwini]
MLQIKKALLIAIFALIFSALTTSTPASCDVQVSRSCPPRRPSFNGIYRLSIPNSLDSFNTFVIIFKEAVYSSQDLTRIFDFDNTPATEFAEYKYEPILDALQKLGAEDQIYLATKAVQPITENFNILSSDLVIQTYARIIAKYLLSQYILTPYNTIRLALAYVREMERAARCYQSQYEAMKEGFVNFLVTLDLFTAENALMVCLAYGNEWKLAAQEYY